MLKKFLRSHPLKLANVRGQAMVIWALFIPLLILFLGVGMDLGWYYLNVSRLQNAADAAALAGARTIINSNTGKLKDLAPVLVQGLPADNGLTDDGEPKVETSTSTETTQTSTETDEGTTITTTETTTTTTTTISKTQLKDLTWTDGDLTARDYTAKNIGTTQNVQADEDETVNLIIDDWSISDLPEDKKVDTNLNLVKVNGDFYYIVTLDENIRHFFLPGWFNDMEAKVVAIAQLVPKDQVVISTSTSVKTFEEFIAKIEEYKNKNVIVGNWEVQNYYRSITTKDGKITLVDDEGNPILDANGNIQYVTATRDKEYSEVFTTAYDKSVGITREVFTNTWSMFEDYKVHFRKGTPIRYEMIDIFDDVKLIDPNLTIAEGKYYKENMKSYGKTNEKSGGGRENNGNVKNPTENGSSVQQTKAAINGTDYKNWDGNPYAWQDLDSIDVDFQPEVSWKVNENSVYPLQDWDLQFGFDKASNNWADGSGNSEVGVGAVYHQKYNNDGSEQSGNNREKGGWQDHLRIHSSLNFKAPYRARPTYEKTHDADTDVLWVRIESEPMFRYPDSRDPKKQKKNHLDIGGLNSVRQIIINFTESNIDKNGEEYRPIVIFYDGPERYSTKNSIRDSQPIIVNLAVPVRAIIYAPNSPVVVRGNAADQFQGFIVAKKYMRLKTTEDFESEDEKYDLYDMADDKGNIVENGSNYRAKKTTDNPYFGTKHTKPDGTVVNYRDNGEPKTINWLYKKITNSPTDTNGNVVGAFDMYVDDYGNVQYVDTDPPTNCGKYDTFGKTDFDPFNNVNAASTSYSYTAVQSSKGNMLLSGVEFDYEKTGSADDGDIRYKGTRVF